MSEKDIIFLIGAAMGLIGGYGIGHIRGQCVGIKWCAKLYSLPIPSSPLSSKEAK